MNPSSRNKSTLGCTKEKGEKTVSTVCIISDSFGKVRQKSSRVKARMTSKTIIIYNLTVDMSLHVELSK